MVDTQSTNNSTPEEIMTVRDVAEYLKLADSTVYRLAQDGKIPASKVGGTWRFLRSELIQWLKSQSSNSNDN